MQTLVVKNLTSSLFGVQDPTGQTPLSFTVRGGATLSVPNLTRDQVDCLEPVLVKAEAAGKITWSVSIPKITTVEAIHKELVEDVPSALLSVDMDKTLQPGSLPPDNTWGGKLFFTLEGTDGNQYQIRAGDVTVTAAVKNTTFTTSARVDDSTSTTQGTITISFTWTSVNRIATLNVTVTSTLTLTDVHIDYFLLYATHDAVTYL